LQLGVSWKTHDTPKILLGLPRLALAEVLVMAGMSFPITAAFFGVLGRGNFVPVSGFSVLVRRASEASFEGLSEGESASGRLFPRG
jgi:hypothetical protein